MGQKQQAILVVDDCPVSRGLLNSILSACGYDTVECGSGTQCLDFLEREVPALILLDISMPDIDGLDLLQQIRQRFSADTLPVLLVTSSSETKDMVRGLTTGANDYLVKPIERTTFLARVYNHISLSQIRRQHDEQRLKVVKLLRVQRAVEDLNNQAVMVHRGDGSLVYCSDLMGRLLGAGASAMNCEAILSRLVPAGVLSEITGEIITDERALVETTIILPPEVCGQGFSPITKVRTAMHGDVRIWVFQVEPCEGVAEQRPQL